jgi:hypothetical protein
MEMMNRLTGNALDSQKFVDAIKAEEQRMQQTVRAERFDHENRTQRRARERAEAKAARKAKA